MQKRKKWLIVIGFIILLQYRGYYIRNLKVDDPFLDVIVEKVLLLEEKRVENLPHTWEDRSQLHGELNTGHMAKNSNLEIEIAAPVQGMSSSLYEYYEAYVAGDYEKAEKFLQKYVNSLNRLQNVLIKLRQQRQQIEILWEKGIFQEE
ncbi:hypothetical protein SAMN05446037_101322 [Anaerovirgula multivorans]|uniref:Uncharacterized protein n=1 Tax=Anaerovirgula multivorans TaxID=312168 RepID=A0A239FHT8_9FIRM|nr:hypothetical protein [Anaerovirgula multivorans]SNS56469.1 hypothetical protein SAMN05446037_101322 [Anaerovirgula multivorans]